MRNLIAVTAATAKETTDNHSSCKLISCGTRIVPVMGRTKEKTTCSGSGYRDLFKSQQDQSFYPLWIPHTLTRSLPVSAMFTRSQLPFPVEGSLLVCKGQSESRVIPHLQLFVPGVSGTGHPLVFLSMRLPRLQDLPTSRVFPLARVFTFIFPGPLLPSKTTFLGTLLFYN